MTGLAFLVFLFDTLLGTLIFVAIAGLIKAWAEREETITEERAPAKPVAPRSAEYKA
ncbi:MAG: hypothetical protein ACE5HA_03570 [Anaerolineae bacterium]